MTFWKKKRKKKIRSFSWGQRGHLRTAMNFQQPSLSMKSLPAECPASLLREPGEVGHTWLRDASCAPPSVLLLLSEQQTVKWEEEVETRNFRRVCSELPPSNHPTSLWISEPNRQQMREPVMQRRDVRLQSQQQLNHTCPKACPCYWPLLVRWTFHAVILQRGCEMALKS